jgi:predicted transcriptional regulator
MSSPEKLDRAQIRAARALLNWNQRDLASAAEISAATVKRIEIGYHAPIRSVTTAIVRALEDQGIEFHHDGKRAGVSVSVKKLPK